MSADARPLVVFGAGGHGKVVADILLTAGHTLAGFVDDAAPRGSTVLGLPVLGAFDWLVEHPARVALGIGDNAARANVADRCAKAGATLVAAIHPRAVIAASARVAPGAVIMALAAVNADAVIEEGCIVNTGAIIEHDCIVERYAHVSPNAVMGGGARLGELGHLGIGATMLPRTTVGPRTVVGGGAVVTSDLPGNTVAVGVPARVRADS